MQNVDALSKSFINQTIICLIKFVDSATEDALQIGMQALKNFSSRLLTFGKNSSSTELDELLQTDYREYTEQRLCNMTLFDVLQKEQLDPIQILAEIE